MKHLILVAAALALAGCSTMRPPPDQPRANFGFRSPDVTMSGPTELLGWYTFERVDLIALIDPANQRHTVPGGVPECVSRRRQATAPTQRGQHDIAQQARAERDRRDGDQGRCELDAAFRYFNTTPAAQLPNAEARRDQIQDRLMAASEQRCEAFKLHLTRNVANTGFAFGAATSILAGAATAFTEVSTVRALAGGAAISNGVGAEYQRNYLHTLTLQIIARGIDIRRQTIRNQIENLRGSPHIYDENIRAPYEPAQPNTGDHEHETGATPATPPPANQHPTPISEYTLERAIGDAVRYHDACSVLAGLEEANKQIDNGTNPTLDSVRQSMVTLTEIAAQTNKLRDELAGRGNSQSGQQPQH